MNEVALWLVVVLAPAIYFVVGYPFAKLLGAPRLALIVGLGLCGWFAEVGFIGKGATDRAFDFWVERLFIWGLFDPWSDTWMERLQPGILGIGFLPLLALCLIAWRNAGFSGSLDCLRESYFFYGLPLAAVLLTPFPGMGVWSTDWYYVYRSGQALMGQWTFGGPLLERPPLGGASCIPMWLIQDGVPTFQVWSAVASTALIMVLKEIYSELGGKRKGVLVWLPLLASCFLLHHTMFGWAKMMAAALTLAGLLISYRSVVSLNLWRWAAGCGLFALGLATHHAGILYAPAMLWLATRFESPDEDARSPIWKCLGIGLVAGLVFAFPFERWTIETFGLDAKIAANPAVAQRDPNEMGLVRVGFMLVSSFVPWNYIDDIQSCVQVGFTWKSLYWLGTGIITALAGTFLGSLLPFLPVRNAPKVERSWLKPILGWPLLFASIALIGNALLSPYYAKWGSAQTGLVPIQAMLYVVMIRWLDDCPERTRRQVNWFSLAIGLAPYALLAGGLTIWICSGPAGLNGFWGWDDNDFRRIFNYTDTKTLAMTLFPFATIVGLIAVATFVASAMRRSRG